MVDVPMHRSFAEDPCEPFDLWVITQICDN